MERPIKFNDCMIYSILDGHKTQTRRPVKLRPDGETPSVTACPYGQPGDTIWVREAFRYGWEDVEYRADFLRLGLNPRAGGPWRPSGHMPRGISRISLEIVTVRIERLHDISYDDALAEGCTDWAALLQKIDQQTRRASAETGAEIARRLRWPQREFELIWTGIYGQQNWAENPSVWVIEFKKQSEE